MGATGNSIGSDCFMASGVARALRVQKAHESGSHQSLHGGGPLPQCKTHACCGARVPACQNTIRAQWQANLRILDINEIKTVTYALDHIRLWNGSSALTAGNTVDLEKRLAKFGTYCNQHRVHGSLDGQAAAEISGKRVNAQLVFHRFRWRTRCRGHSSPSCHRIPGITWADRSLLSVYSW